VINAYFPGATGPDYINDFGMTSPKAIARSFTRYAHRHPEAQFHVLHYAQIPGTIKRSTVARAGTEQLFRSKKLLVPMAIFADHALPIVAASYLLTGRFDPQNELEKHPTAESTELERQIRMAKTDDDEELVKQLEEEKNQQILNTVGTGGEWRKYRTEFDSMVAQNSREESVPERGALNHFFQRLEKAETPVADPNGSLWMEFSDGGETSRVGLSANNIFSSSSNPALAHQLLLARVGRVLKSPKHSRETLAEFKSDWKLLQSAPVFSAENSTTSGAGSASSGTRRNSDMLFIRK